MTFGVHRNWLITHVFARMQKVIQGVPADESRFQSLIPDEEALRANKVMEYLKRKNIMELNEIILVSSCLLGKKCRYNGTHALNSELVERLKGERVIDCCPEIMADLPTPRPPCNIHGGDGLDVLEGNAKIIGVDGKDYTKMFIKGAKLALPKALDNNVVKAILKKNSPSCGCGKIYYKDGKNLVDGDGVFAALLKNNGIDVESL